MTGSLTVADEIAHFIELGDPDDAYEAGYSAGQEDAKDDGEG